MRSFIIASASAITLFSWTALAQEPSQSTASVPDFSGTWVHSSTPGFEPLASGPTSLVNRSRRTIAQQLRDLELRYLATELRDLATDWEGAGEPPSQHGVSNLNEHVGDYTNPILKREAAKVVKKLGEMSIAGVVYPTPRTQCWPGGVPFVFTSGVGNMQILQQPDKIAILYIGDVRHVRFRMACRP